jgi:predicted ATPase
VFKHTGDGMCAAFESASGAVATAVAAQRGLDLPVRMGLASGEGEAAGEDYFGPTLNRAARVMSAGHGGQILAAASTVELVDGLDVVDLGPRRLRDLAEALRIFQVRAEGLVDDFPPLKTLDAVPGNLPVQATSFVGRESQVAELAALVDEHRLVTLVGVGGVGKTRLALQVASSLSTAFFDGVWLVELAAVGDPASLPDLVATSLAVTPQAGESVTDGVVRTLAGRRLLLVLDNCEHVLDAAADLVESILAATDTVRLVATSREALRVPAEHTWAVPSLDVSGDREGEAVALFVDRARAVRRGFAVDEPADLAAVAEICARLDGIALAIELAAARMVSMSVQEVRDRLDDRFRLLSGGRRGLERHQTLRQAVQWSYDLLDDDEKAVLGTCSVFADGFDLAAVTAVHGTDDDLTVLDLMDSLVRKSLVVVELADGRTRYGVLETIRQFAEEQLLAAGLIAEARDRHARYFAEAVQRNWAVWDGPDQRRALDWADGEFANLRAAFRWTADQGQLVVAAAIAAHTAIEVWPLQRFEPVTWAEEILDAASAAQVEPLPRLLVAASLCLYTGRPDDGVVRAQAAAALEADPRFVPFEDGWSGILEALAHLFGGRIERRVEICTELAGRQGFARVVGLAGLTWALPAIGRADEARAIAAEALAEARAYGNPFWIGWALGGYGRAFADTEPLAALDALREGLAFAAAQRLPFWQANLAQDAARLEAVHGELGEALDLFGDAIDSFDRAGNVAFLAATLASLAVFFDRHDRPAVAATIYGSSTRHASIGLVPRLAEAVSHLETVLGDDFAGCVAAGVAMDDTEAVRHAQRQIQLARESIS